MSGSPTTLTHQEEEAIKVLVARVPRDGVGRLPTYLLVAQGIGLATCFTTVGAGWANAQIVSIVERLVPVLLVGLLLAGVPVFISRIVADSVIKLEYAVDKKPELVRAAVERSYSMFMLGDLASFLSMIVFIICICYAWYEIKTKNFASRSNLEISSVLILNHQMHFLIANNGGVPGLITGAQLSVGLKPLDWLELDLPLPSSMPLFLNPGQNKELSVDLHDADTEIQQYIAGLPNKNFETKLILGKCTVYFFVHDHSVFGTDYNPSFSGSTVRSVNVNCWDLVSGLLLQPGSAIRK